MGKARTLARVENDLTRGDLGKARDRMHGLVAQYPDDISLRAKLAEIYARLHYPQMAGRYWYLEQEKTSAMREACLVFERSCGGDPLPILLALKFRGDPATLTAYPRGRLEDLQRRCLERHGFYPDQRYHGRDRWRPSQKRTRMDRVLAAGFGLFLMGFVFLAALGLVALLTRLSGLR